MTQVSARAMMRPPSSQLIASVATLVDTAYNHDCGLYKHKMKVHDKINLKLKKGKALTDDKLPPSKWLTPSGSSKRQYSWFG